MNCSPKKWCFSFLILVSASIVFGQKKEPAHIRFYRNDRFFAQTQSLDVQINKRDVFTFKPGIKKYVALDYAIASEGRLLIGVSNWSHDWRTTVTLDVEAGKTYYIKVDCTVSGITLDVNHDTSKDDWSLFSKDFLTTMAEDEANPFVVKETPPTEAAPVTKQVVRVDTVKQYVYVTERKKYNFEPYADIDRDMPTTSHLCEQTFALIIGNEDYSIYQTELKKEANVLYAKNDAFAFKEYAMKTMGIPERNINLVLDGTYGQMSLAISKLNLIAKNTAGKASLIVYYAGHGMPDEQTKEPYLIPVDINGTNVRSAIRLKDLYSKLTEFPCEKVYVFLDACFTGGAREEGLVAARGVSIKPKEELLNGNIVVFSSSSGNQSSLAFSDKKHGMFTYYMLKKLQDTKGEATMEELSAYVKERVSIESLLVNDKEQNPQVNTSSSVSDTWGKWKLTNK